MKYLLVIGVVLLGWFLWRRPWAHRRQARNDRPAAPEAAAEPQAMVRCPVCALHLPEADAVPGRRGRYCSEAHRLQAEG